MEAISRRSTDKVNFLVGNGELAQLIRERDWSTTPLGPIARWPQSLRTTVSLCLASNFPINIIWGPQHTQLYNDGYRVLCGEAHPRALGEAYSTTWASAWPAIGEPFELALAGETSYLENQRMFLTRNGYLEETFFTFSLSPIRDESGEVGGVFHPVTETTTTMLTERRTRALRELSASIAAATDERDLALRAGEVFSHFQFDLPFALIYVLDAPAYMLAASQGVAAGHAGAPASDQAADLFPWPFAAAAESESKILAVDALHSRIPAWSAGPYEEAPHRALVLKVEVPGVERAPLMIVAGVSPRLPLNEAYQSFYDLLLVTISSALAVVRTREDERLRAEALAKIDRAKTAFFSNISHEFRTPLTLMLGPLEDTLAATDIPAHARDKVRLAQRSAQRLLKLVNSLLDFSRLEAGRLQASYEATDLCALTRDVASTFRSAIERAGLQFSVSCENPGVRVHVDRDMWEKIVLNLLSNAFKFTLTGTISVRLRQEASAAVFEIADTGVGVPQHEMPRLFERFHQVEGTHGRTHEGSGIGLAFVQELIKLHGGTITARSELGAGTTFCVRLPLGAAHLQPERIIQSRALVAASAVAETFVHEALRWLPAADDSVSILPATEVTSPILFDKRFANTAGSRIVLADDNADIRSYLRELLAPHYAVEAVADGAQALAAARRELPDLILTDVMMPHIDGFELLSAVRADDALRHVPVVLLSARAGEEARIEGLDAGADDYLIKPFSGRELLARVGALLELRLIRHSTEEALRRRTEQFEVLLEAAPLGIYLVDANFRLREVNATALPVFGDIPDLIGRDFAEVMHILWPRKFADEVVGRFRHTLQTGEQWMTPELAQQRCDRDVKEHYEWQISRIPLNDEGFGVVCYFRDISVQVDAQCVLLKQRATLQVMDRQKDEFLAMLAHELRNPLAPIRNAGELLARMEPANTQADEAIRIVNRQTTHLSRLVDDLLDVSRITQRRVDLKQQVISLDEVVVHALEVAEPLIREKSHVLINSSIGGPFHVYGDFARLVQCVSNLVTNAAKYTGEAGMITIEMFCEEPEVVLRVSDNGPGIAAELLPLVFDLFVQSKRTLDRAQGGLGIGLSLVRELVALHGGTVSVASDDKGSAFDIRLPRVGSASQPFALVSRAEQRPLRILIVDDNEDAANSIALLLGFEGHTIEPVFTSQRALEQLNIFRPDVVLLDLGLPHMDGFEVARRIRATQGFDAVRIIALTGYGQAEDRQRTHAAGFDAHLVKPVSYAELERALGQIPG